MNATALAGMGSPSAAMREEERAGVATVIVNESAELVRAHTEGKALAFEVSTNVATARG